MKLGPQRNYHEGQAAIRHYYYANQPGRLLRLLRRHPNFTSTYYGVNARLEWCLNSVLNVKALVCAFNQEKALVGAFSVIVQPVVEPMDSLTALVLRLLTLTKLSQGHSYYYP